MKRGAVKSSSRRKENLENDCAIVVWSCCGQRYRVSRQQQQQLSLWTTRNESHYLENQASSNLSTHPKTSTTTHPFSPKKKSLNPTPSPTHASHSFSHSPNRAPNHQPVFSELIELFGAFPKDSDDDSVAEEHGKNWEDEDGDQLKPGQDLPHLGTSVDVSARNDRYVVECVVVDVPPCVLLSMNWSLINNMNEWMDEWMNEWMNEWVDGWINEYIIII